MDKSDDFLWFIRFLHDFEYESGMPYAFELTTETIASMLTLSAKGKEEVIYRVRNSYSYMAKYSDAELFTTPIKTGLFGLTPHFLVYEKS